MKGLFVDTAGWVACADAADPAHEQRLRHEIDWLEQGGLLVTTDYVADETLTLLRLRLGLASGGSAGGARWMAARVCVGSPSRWPVPIRRAACSSDTATRSFSFTDCTSFAGHARAEAARSARPPIIISPKWASCKPALN